MRWLLVGLLISVAVLLMVAIAVARHILRQRVALPEDLAQSQHTDEELDLPELQPKNLGGDNESSH